MAKVNGFLITKETPDVSYTIYGELFNQMSRDIIDFNGYLLGLDQVWDNPNLINPSEYNGHEVGYEYADNVPVPEEMRYHKKIEDGSAPAPWHKHDEKNRVTNTDVNQIVDNIKTVTAKARTLKIGLNTSDNAVVHVNKGDKITISMNANIATVLTEIQDTINAHSNYWDTNNLCARSCQISCQVGCQVMCQSCVSSNCHIQHCGGCT